MERILSARYGKDVRQSIHDAIYEMNDQIENSETSAANSALEAAKSANQAAISEENALEYANSSLESANSAQLSEESALDSANSAETSAQGAESASLSAQNSAEESAKSAEASVISESNALLSANSAKEYADQINEKIDIASQSAEVAEEAAQSAEKSAEEAEVSAGLAEQQALMAESYTHGGTGLRTNEAVDNAQYYLEQAKQLSQSMNGLIPMGTVSFADLSVAENQVDKYMFNISDDFTTDDTFKEGAGHEFPAGTNVYRTNDGYWDCLAGSFQTPNGDTKDNTTSFVQATSRANITSGEKHSTIFGKIAKIFADLKTVAFSGSYSDLSNTPTAATTSAAGLMSASDKSKLDGIASGANAYTHPTTSGNKHIPSGGSSGQILRWSADGTAAWGADNNTVYTHPSYTARTGVPTANQTPAFGGTFSVSQPVSDATGHITALTTRKVTIPSTAATTSAAGLMSASDKSKLDGIDDGATKTTVDSALSSTSANPVQNKVVNAAITGLKTISDIDVGVSTMAGRRQGDTVTIYINGVRGDLFTTIPAGNRPYRTAWIGGYVINSSGGWYPCIVALKTDGTWAVNAASSMGTTSLTNCLTSNFTVYAELTYIAEN